MRSCSIQITRFFWMVLPAYVAVALKAGDVAMVVATQSHWDRLGQRLKSQGLDVDAAIQQGTHTFYWMLAAK